jgi:4-diphosphocytidyl-2-C-methyl-D-erythritol kinase
LIVEPAPAKINLALHVRHRRPDGYHELETLFAFATDGDVIRVARADHDSFTITGPYASALKSSPERGGGPAKLVEGAQPQVPNLVEQARNAFRATFDLPPVATTLEKNLPIASGIGGGSADAAATLRALARLTGTPIDDPRLDAIARTLGADVPACLHGTTSLGTGRGDDLVPLAGLAGTPLLLVNPGVAVSTAQVFAAWDGIDRGPIGEGDLLARAAAGRNDLEPPARALAPAIDQVLAQLSAVPGLLLARMSGSGATCFALFDRSADRDAAARDAAGQGWWTLATTMR